MYVNSYPRLFPGGIEELYDMEWGKWGVKEWEQRPFHYYIRRFHKDKMFSLFVFNSIERHTNNTQGHFFFKSSRCIGENPPTIKELKERLAKGGDSYIQILRHYAHGIKGSDNYWRGKTMELGN